MVPVMTLVEETTWAAETSKQSPQIQAKADHASPGLHSQVYIALAHLFLLPFKPACSNPLLYQNILYML